MDWHGRRGLSGCRSLPLGLGRLPFFARTLRRAKPTGTVGRCKALLAKGPFGFVRFRSVAGRNEDEDDDEDDHD